MEAKTLRVKEDHWLLRLYAYSWETNAADADLCRLFWGTLFVWLPYLFVGVIYFFWPVWRPIELLAQLRRRRKYERLELLREMPPEPAEPRGRAEWLDSIINLLIGIRLWPIWRYIGMLIIGIVGIALLACVGICVYLVVIALSHLDTWIWLVIIGGAALIATLLWAGLMIERRWPGTLFSPFKKGGQGTAGFFKIMGAGLHAFKERTCPRIEVVKTREE